MRSRIVCSAWLILLILLAGTLPTTGAGAGSLAQNTAPALPLPDNTVILANARDARFARDYSVLLKHLRLEWVVLDSAIAPDHVRDKHVVLLGHPDAEHSGELIRKILSAAEIERLRAATDHHMVIETVSPWSEDRVVTICAGADMLLTRNAAEEAFRAIIASAPPASDWIQTTYDAPLDENVRERVGQLRYQWDDTELPLAELTLDPKAKPRKSVTAAEAAEDVERLFYLLSHGYSGYAYFNEQGEFEEARARILGALASQASWSSTAFSSLIHEHLGFIVDGHLNIGNLRFASHRDFWFDTQYELTPANDGFRFVDNDVEYMLISVNDADPAPYVFPSLNRLGEPIYRLGMLATSEPAPLLLAAGSEEGERQFDITLERSDFKYYSEDVFQEVTLGGIPVLRARSFSDMYEDDLNQFVAAAGAHRGEPAIILDIRGNGGGNERWPVGWIQRLTSRRAESVFAYSQLESKTSMAGRANAFVYWDANASAPSFYAAEAERHTHIAQEIENGARASGWTAPRYPQMPLIANQSTVIVVTNALVASAGEGMVMRISQLENVMVVGENSMGALTFGNVSAHQLPHSKLMIWMPINFGLYLDQTHREAVGLEPDLWVPAADAVDYAVAALRRGTITTALPLTQATLESNFKPEASHSIFRRFSWRSWLVVIPLLGAAIVVGYFLRKKPRNLIGSSVSWMFLAWVWFYQMDKPPVGVGFALAGIVCLVWGVIALLRERRARRGD